MILEVDARLSVGQDVRRGCRRGRQRLDEDHGHWQRPGPEETSSERQEGRRRKINRVGSCSIFYTKLVLCTVDHRAQALALGGQTLNLGSHARDKSKAGSLNADGWPSSNLKADQALAVA